MGMHMPGNSCIHILSTLLLIPVQACAHGWAVLGTGALLSITQCDTCVAKAWFLAAVMLWTSWRWVTRSLCRRRTRTLQQKARYLLSSMKHCVPRVARPWSVPEDHSLWYFGSSLQQL
eukprot:1160633-Pelagomonas_calceolata.AAC.10